MKAALLAIGAVGFCAAGAALAVFVAIRAERRDEARTARPVTEPFGPRSTSPTWNGMTQAEQRFYNLRIAGDLGFK